MTRQFICFLITVSFLSCQTRQKFDKEKMGSGCRPNDLPNRNSMLEDLTYHFQLKGKRYCEIIDLPGQPQGKADNDLQIFYDIDVDYGYDIDPVYSKTLTFQFNKDSLVDSFEINEWKK